MASPYTVLDEAITEDVATQLLRAATSSAHLGPSQLVGTFGRTLGFGLVFCSAQRRDAIALAPGLAPFIALVCDRVSLRGESARRLFRRHAPAPPSAFYVNALVLEGGAEVGPHVDGTLGPALGEEGRTPAFVSVLYLDVPPPPRGNLVLARGPIRVGSIEPKARRLVCFDGTLGHSVNAHADASSGEDMRRRVSLVCEHYVASDVECERLGPARLHSRSKGPVFPRPDAARPFSALIRPRS